MKIYWQIYDSFNRTNPEPGRFTMHGLFFEQGRNTIFLFGVVGGSALFRSNALCLPGKCTLPSCSQTCFLVAGASRSAGTTMSKMLAKNKWYEQITKTSFLGVASYSYRQVTTASACWCILNKLVLYAPIMRKIQCSPFTVVECSFAGAHCIRLGKFPIEVHQQFLAIAVLSIPFCITRAASFNEKKYWILAAIILVFVLQIILLSGIWIKRIMDMKRTTEEFIHSIKPFLRSILTRISMKSIFHLYIFNK